MDLTPHVEQQCTISGGLGSPHLHTADDFQGPHQLHNKYLHDTPWLSPTTGNLRPFGPHLVDLTLDPHQSANETLSALAQYPFPDHLRGGPPIHYTATLWDPINAFVTQNQWPSYAMGQSSLVNDNRYPIEILLDQPQPDDLSYPGNSAQNAQPYHINEGETALREEQAQSPQQQIPRYLALQVPFKPSRRQTKSTNPDVIQFIVNGKEGICLSNALEGNWVGLEGRDDRSLFGDCSDRIQILVRIHPVGCPPWKSKICTANFTAKPRPITRTKLATGVAKSVQRFIAREKLDGHGAGHTRCVDWADVSLKSLFLTRMVRVSMASWQPEIFVEQQSAATVPTQS